MEIRTLNGVDAEILQKGTCYLRYCYFFPKQKEHIDILYALEIHCKSYIIFSGTKFMGTIKLFTVRTYLFLLVI